MTTKKTATAAKRPATKKAASKTPAKAGAKKRGVAATTNAAAKKPTAPKSAPQRAVAAKSEAKPSVAKKAAAPKKPKSAATNPETFDPDRRREMIAAAAARRRKLVTAKAAPTQISIIKPREPSPVERHRFSVGEDVRVISTSGMWFKHGIEFKVTAALPPQGGKLQYRIKNDQEPFERVVSESQLAAAQA